MTSRLVSVVFDANDHRAQAHWWADTLDAPVAGEDADEAWLTPPDSPEILFGVATEPKREKNRVHLDLATYSKAEHTALVASLLERGATRVDLGQGDVDWVVLADPEGNEFCVVEPRPLHRYSGRIATIMLETANAEATGQFWAEASGWNVFSHGPDGAVMREASWRGPWLVIGDHDDPPRVKNRVHFDVAPMPEDDHHEEVERLIAAGASRVDIGQGDVPWVVLTDPGGNEFCVLTPR